MLKSVGTSLILRGVLALGVGILTLAWPGLTVLALVILFAVYAFTAAGLEAAIAFSQRDAKPVAKHLLLGLVDVAAGVVTLAWPGATALVLVWVIAGWTLVTGGIEVYAAFRSGEPAGARALLVVAGLVSTAFGLVLVAHPAAGALSLALLYGFYNLVAGTSWIVQGVEVQKTDRAFRSLVEPQKTRVSA